MLNQDLRPFYMPFLEVSIKMLAECPLGSFAMLLLDASLKIANTQETPRLNEMPSFLRAQELLQEILDSGISLTEVATSGWMIFNQVSVLRTAVQRRGHGLDVVGTCAQIPLPESLPARMLQTMLEGVSFLPVGAYSILQLFLRDANLVGAKVPLCSFAGPAMHLLVAYSSLQQTAPDQAQLPVPGAPASPKDEAAQMIQLGDEQLRVALLAESAATGSTGTVGALALMLVTPWPIPEVLDLLSHPGRVNMEVQTAMEDLLHLEEGHPLWDKAQSGRSSYFFRVNPYREMVSDMVRYTKMPFCGLRPFLRMVADVAKAAMSAGCATPGVYLEDSRTCEFTFVEGGPHLGDCAMWATTVLRLAGVQTRSIAFEPLQDAAALFQQSVLENGLASHVSVQNAALGQSSGTMTELIHFRGHNGQATVNGEDFPSQDRREVVTIQAQQLALDDEIPPSWPHIDALKLSVNGAERNTLAGARKLLSKRRICSVLMHATKCKRGRRPASEDPAPGNVSKFAYDLMMFLEEGHRQVHSMPFQVNAVALSTALAACEVAGRWEIALQLIAERAEILDLACLNCAINCCERGSQWKHALAVFDKVCGSRIQTNGKGGILLGSEEEAAKGLPGVWPLQLLWCTELLVVRGLLRPNSAPAQADPSSSSRPKSGRGSGTPVQSVASGARVDTTPQRPMEPALLDLLEDCPRDVSLWLEGLRVQTCADVCHMWHSGTEMVEEYEAGERMSADMAFKLAMMWTLASQRSAVQRDQAVQALVSERESTCPSRPVLSLETAPTDPARAPIRSMVATGLTSAVPPRIISANADPHVKEQAVKEVKIQALFQLALEDLLDLQSLGTTVQALQDPLRLQAFKDSVMTSAQRLGVERIGALTSALKRWKRYALDKGYSVKSPSPLQLNEFLRSVSSGGPTAATSMYQAFKWFQHNMGINFQVDLFLLSTFRFHAQGHTGAQAKEMELWEILNLIFMAKKASGTRLLVLAFYAQRSTLQQTSGAAMRFTCRQGKSRRQGSRPAYDWVTTEAFCGRHCCWKRRTFGRFTTPLPCSSTSLCREHATLSSSVGAFWKWGLEQQEATNAGYNRLRRFMPTLAGCLQVSKEDLQAVGSWIELPAGGGPQGKDRRERAALPMGLHYSGQKTHRSAVVKLKLWKRFMFLARRKMSGMALTQDGLLTPKSWMWPEFCQDHLNAPEGGDEIAEEEIFTAPVNKADRGLATCFEAANIEAAWRDEFLHKHRIQTLDDFVYMVTHGEWERSLTELVDSCSGLKSNRVILSRFKAAWESGSAAVKQAAQPASKGAADQLDEMLPESTLATVSRDFRTRYSHDVTTKGVGQWLAFKAFFPCEHWSIVLGMISGRQWSWPLHILQVMQCGNMVPPLVAGSIALDAAADWKLTLYLLDEMQGPAQSDSEIMALVVAACQEQQRHEQLGRLLEDAWTGDTLNQTSQDSQEATVEAIRLWCSQQAAAFGTALNPHLRDMDVYEHNDAKEGKGRGRVRRLTTAQEMDGIFDDPELTEQVYFLALSKDQNCGRAKRHFNIAAGRPPTAMLEDRGM
eukprot:symbB.v1.2.024570.t1/scaffold2273.1/size83577/1